MHAQKNQGRNAFRPARGLWFLIALSAPTTSFTLTRSATDRTCYERARWVPGKARFSSLQPRMGERIPGARLLGDARGKIIRNSERLQGLTPDGILPYR